MLVLHQGERLSWQHIAPPGQVLLEYRVRYSIDLEILPRSCHLHQSYQLLLVRVRRLCWFHYLREM